MGSLAGPSPAMARTPFTPWPPSCEMRISLGPQKDREGQIRLEQYRTIKLLGVFFCVSISFYIVLDSMVPLYTKQQVILKLHVCDQNHQGKSKKSARSKSSFGSKAVKTRSVPCQKTTWQHTSVTGNQQENYEHLDPVECPKNTKIQGAGWY
jgi:hypothetical protein